MSNTYYNNDDIMQNIDKVADDVTAIKDIIINLAKDNIRLESKVNKLQIEQAFPHSVSQRSHHVHPSKAHR